MGTSLRQAGRDESENPAEPSITVTRHALDRYAERARLRAPAAALEATLRDHVLRGIAHGCVLRASAEIHLLPLQSPRGSWLCLIMRLTGQAANPAAVFVYTILTEDMAIKTFGHVIGLIDEMASRTRLETIA